MADHFAAIGFRTGTVDELVEILNRVSSQLRTKGCSHGTYAHWSSSQGAELWLHLDGANQLQGLDPFFRGTTRMRLGIVTRIQRSDDDPFDGIALAIVQPHEERPDRGVGRLALSLIDYGLHEELPLPLLADYQVAAFAHDLSIYESDEIFSEAQESGIQFSPESQVPIGLFVSDRWTAPAPFAQITGHVLSSAVLTNPLTGQAYHHLEVRTFGGDVDLVAEAGLYSGIVPVGSVVSAECWVCGRMLEDPQPASPVAEPRP